MNLSSVDAVKHSPNIPEEKKSFHSMILWFGMTFVLYFIFAWGAIYLSRQSGSIATFWYANAIAVCMLLARRKNERTTLLISIAFANAIANFAFNDPLLLILSFIAGNLIEIELSVFLLERFCTIEKCISHINIFLRALFFSGVIAPFAGAIIGASILSFYGFASFYKVCFSWFEGSAIGSMSILPIGFYLLNHGWKKLVNALKDYKVFGIILFALAIVIEAPTSLLYPYVYISLALALVAYIGGFAAAATAALISSTIVATVISFGILQPPSTDIFTEFFFYLPVILALIPPLMLAVSLERVRETIKHLATQELHYRSLYQQTPTMMHSLDINGNIVNVSQTWLDRLQYKKEEVLGRPSLDFLTAASRQYAQEIVLPLFIKEGYIHEAEYQMVTKYGEIVEVLLSAIWEYDDDGKRIKKLSVINDITERKRLAIALAAEQELIKVTLHSIGDGVVSTDKEGNINYLNPVAEEIVGWSVKEAHGLPFTEVVCLFDHLSGHPLQNPLQQCLTHQMKYGLTKNASLRSRNGKEYGIQNSVAPIRDSKGALLGSVMVFQDVTEARHLTQKMSSLAHYDGLTDLPNRILFHDRLHLACQNGLRFDEKFAVVFMDIDHFKYVNDSFGHAAGDVLLRTLADRLKGALRQSDTISRMGGDEFVMLLPKIEDTSSADDLANKIMQRVALPLIFNGIELAVTISLGISMFPKDGTDPETLMKHADIAMYRTKREGRNGYQFFSKSIDKEAVVDL